MSNYDAIDIDQAQKVDFGIWKKLLRYTLHYTTTARWFALSALGIALSDICFPLLTGRLISAVERGDSNLAPYGWAFLVLTVVICIAIWGFIRSAAKIRTHVSHDIRRDAFEKLQQLGKFSQRVGADSRSGLSHHVGIGEFFKCVRALDLKSFFEVGQG